ncbi:MAG: hypothetical protein GFGODING_01266 [Flavobacteriales bacterium]|nr:hypothetical protein [Flavobacteriales bacterium]
MPASVGQKAPPPLTVPPTGAGITVTTREVLYVQLPCTTV